MTVSNTPVNTPNVIVSLVVCVGIKLVYLQEFLHGTGPNPSNP